DKRGRPEGQGCVRVGGRKEGRVNGDVHGGHTSCGSVTQLLDSYRSGHLFATQGGSPAVARTAWLQVTGSGLSLGLRPHRDLRFLPAPALLACMSRRQTSAKSLIRCADRVAQDRFDIGWRNLRCHWGEIDLVVPAVHDQTLTHHQSIHGRERLWF